MKKLIDSYSADKIVIKYHLIETKIEPRTRKKFSVVIAITGTITLLLLVYVLSSIFSLNSWTSVLSAFILTFGSVYLIDKLYLQKFHVIGELRFLNDQLEIQYYNKPETDIINYDTIEKVHYCGDIVKSNMDKYRQYKSFLVKLTLTNKKGILLKPRTTMFLTDKDKNEFRRPEPYLEVTLENIPSKRGTFENKRLRTTTAIANAGLKV